MIKTILAWITGKSDTKAAEVPYKVEAPAVAPEVTAPTVAEAVVIAPEAVIPAALEVAPVTVKAKYKRADLNKMTKAQLMELVGQHSLDVKARATKEEIVKALVKV
jgi:hypothetical protein